MGKNKSYMILGVGVLIALVVSLLSYSWLQKKATMPTKQALETEQVVVATADMPWGTVLSRELVKTVPFLKKSLPEGYHTDPSKLEGRTILYPVRVNEMISESKLAPASLQGGGVAAVISPKKRAVAVKVDKVIGVSGFIHPANRVDVLVTISQTARNMLPVTKTVLENILVLATGQEVEKSGKREKPSQVDVITLEVTPEEGEKLALAASEGKIQLALRNLADGGDVNTKGSTIPTLLASYGGAAAPKERAQTHTPRSVKPAPASVQPTVAVEVIKGSAVTSLNFKKGE